MRMKKKSKSLRIIPSPKEMADITTQGVHAAVINLPMANTNIVGYLLTVGATFSAFRIGEWGKSFVEYLKKSNHVKREGPEADKAYQKFLESLRFMNQQQVIDEEWMEALKFLHAKSFDLDTKESEAAEIYMIIEKIKKMNGPEIRTVLEAYKIHHKLYSQEKINKIMEGYQPNIVGVEAWCVVVSRACGYSQSGFIKDQQEHLEELGLISPREVLRGDLQHTFTHTSTFRLTSIGAQMAELILDGKKLQDHVIQKV
jgi:hypothetical protein